MEDALPELLLPSMDVGIQLVPVLPNRKLLVIIDGYVDAASADWLILRVMELSNVRVSKRLLSRQASIRIEVQEVAQQVEGVVGSRGEHVPQALGLGRWQRFEHCWR